MFGFFNVYFILNTKNYNYIFISIIPTIILYFLFHNFKNIDAFQWWSMNDDWEIFRVFAREIVVDNIWVNQSEAEYRYRPGIRYFFALNHYLFSKSSFVDALLEIYAILFASFSLFKSFKNFEIDERVAFSISLILLFIFFSTNHRWLIGRGLTEYYALFNIKFLLYLISKI